ncbi:hypothetical protein BKA56DRAFT_660241 [Ilyonectria sp. MPI-CAGE-AT-0026]|nr:hypothetical protein BKA56DRAFT_660241 [Ilyonectria sp. MPI-CAGE-AT-0026]
MSDHKSLRALAGSSLLLCVACITPEHPSSYIIPHSIRSFVQLRTPPIHAMRSTTILTSLAAFGIASTHTSRWQHSPSGTTTVDITPTKSPATQPNPTSVCGGIEFLDTRLTCCVTGAAGEGLTVFLETLKDNPYHCGLPAKITVLATVFSSHY